MAPQRDLAIHFVEHFVRIFGALHGSEHISRRNRADANLGRQLQSHRARQLDHTGLRSIVIGIEGVPHDAVGRSGLQNHAAVTLPHVPGSSLSHVEAARQVNRDYLVPFLGRDLQKTMPDADAGVIDKHIHTAHEPNRIVQRRLHLLEIGDVRIHSAFQLRQLMANSFPRLAVAVEHHYCRPFFKKPLRRGSPNATCASSDQHTLAFESSHQFSFPLSYDFRINRGENKWLRNAVMAQFAVSLKDSLCVFANPWRSSRLSSSLPQSSQRTAAKNAKPNHAPSETESLLKCGSIPYTTEN